MLHGGLRQAVVATVPHLPQARDSRQLLLLSGELQLRRKTSTRKIRDRLVESSFLSCFPYHSRSQHLSHACLCRVHASEFYNMHCTILGVFQGLVEDSQDRPRAKLSGSHQRLWLLQPLAKLRIHRPAKTVLSPGEPKATGTAFVHTATCSLVH